MASRNIIKTFIMLLMILKLSILSQPTLNEEKPKDIVIQEVGNDPSNNKETIVLHLFVTPPKVNLIQTLIEPILAPINQKNIVEIMPITSKEDKKTKPVNVKEVNKHENTITKDIETSENLTSKESVKNKSLTSKEDEEAKLLIPEKDNIEESTIEQQSDEADDSTPENKDVCVKNEKSSWSTAMVFGSVLMAILISGFFIVSISCSGTLTKKMFAFVPLCIISIAFGYLAKELLKVVPILGICLLFIVICD